MSERTGKWNRSPSPNFDVGALFFYEPKDGTLRWKAHTQASRVGTIAGSVATGGYMRVSLSDRDPIKPTRISYTIHYLIWFLHHGDVPEGFVIDHEDRNRLNNRIENLRLLTWSDNVNNSDFSGRGVSKDRGKFVARSQVNGSTVYIGAYDSRPEAEEAYMQFRRSLGRND